MTVLLALQDVEAAYGSTQALFGVSLNVKAGEVVTLLGRNGMGKTTIVRTIMGMLVPTGGSVTFRDQTIGGWPSYRIARFGIGLVPEGRRIFPNLSVRENLLATMNLRSRDDRPLWTLDDIFALFPRLRERLENGGSQLSGGEQQMLAIGRAMLTNPALMIFDEATEGLAPLVREEIWACIETAKTRGQSILLIDKNIDHLLRLGNHHYIVEKGQTVWSGSTADLRRSPDIASTFLAI